MAKLAKVSIQALVKSCGISEACLDREVTYERFNDISSYLTQWKRIVSNLNISQDEVDAIENDNPKKAEMQRISLLHTWKQKMSFTATYRALVDALLDIGRAEDARGVCQILKGKHISTGLNITVQKWRDIVSDQKQKCQTHVCECQSIDRRVFMKLHTRHYL